MLYRVCLPYVKCEMHVIGERLQFGARVLNILGPICSLLTISKIFKHLALAHLSPSLRLSHPRHHHRHLDPGPEARYHPRACLHPPPLLCRLKSGPEACRCLDLGLLHRPCNHAVIVDLKYVPPLSLSPWLLHPKIQI
jgi:hypothetical protein